MIVSTVEVDKLMDETTLNIITNIGGLTGGMFYIVWDFVCAIDAIHWLPRRLEISCKGVIAKCDLDKLQCYAALCDQKEVYLTDDDDDDDDVMMQ